jgi:hypothetical protein
VCALDSDKAITGSAVLNNIHERHKRIADYVKSNPLPDHNVAAARQPLNTFAGRRIEQSHHLAMLQHALQSLQKEEKTLLNSGNSGGEVLENQQRQAYCQAMLQQARDREASGLFPPAARPRLRWSQVREVNERFLDATNPGDIRLRDLFNRRTHIAIKSAQGTGKTDAVILVELLRLLWSNPQLRVLWLSNRQAYRDDVNRRCRKFELDMKGLVDVSCGFRTYDEFDAHTDEGNSALINTPRLICSLESLPRLSGMKRADGSLHRARYDLIIMDEMMELHSIFHGATMNDKRRIVLELLCAFCTSAQRVWAADADLTDDTALPFLHDLCTKSFAKLLNTRKTICRRYFHHTEYGACRSLLIQKLRQGKKVVVVSNTKREVLVLADDPDIQSLDLRLAALTRASSPDVYEKYIRTTERWSELDLLIYSPIISSGLDFSKEHFDTAFFFGSDRSATVRQAFQQINRVRHVRDNEVHVYLSLHPGQHVGLSVSTEAVERDINSTVARMKFDYAVRMGRSSAGRRDRGLDVDHRLNPDTHMRELLQTGYNHIFIRNQLAVNRSRVQFRELLFQSAAEAGGSIEMVIEAPNPAADQAHRMKTVAVQDEQLRTVLAAREITTEVDYTGTLRRVQHPGMRQDGDLEALEKANIKKLYQIPLSDTQTMASIAGFMKLYGSEEAQRQAKHMLWASKGGSAKLQQDAARKLEEKKEYPEHMQEILAVHSVAEQLLTELGFSKPSSSPERPVAPSCIWSADFVYESAQVVRLAGDAAQRAKLLELLNTNALLRPWWQQYQSGKRTKQLWTVEQNPRTQDFELHVGARTSAGGAGREPSHSRDERVEAEVLVGILVAAARALLKRHFQVGLRSGRTKVVHSSIPAEQRKPNQRYQYFMLDRKNWDRWAVSVFRQPLQKFETTEVGI